MISCSQVRRHLPTNKKHIVSTTIPQLLLISELVLLLISLFIAIFIFLISDTVMFTSTMYMVKLQMTIPFSVCFQNGYLVLIVEAKYVEGDGRADGGNWLSITNDQCIVEVSIKVLFVKSSKMVNSSREYFSLFSQKFSS